MKWKIYHNPKCSKSRECLSLLEKHKLELEVVEYLKFPPNVSSLNALAKKLGLQPRDIIRQKEEIFSQLKLDLNNQNSLLAAIEQHPILLERPIIEYKGKAVLGRPVDNLEKFLKEELD
jgi:arsenate reductase